MSGDDVCGFRIIDVVSTDWIGGLDEGRKKGRKEGDEVGEVEEGGGVS